MSKEGITNLIILELTIYQHALGGTSQIMLLLSQLNTLLFILHLLPAVYSHVLEVDHGEDAREPGGEHDGEPGAIAVEQKRSTKDKVMEMDKKAGKSKEIARLEEFLVKSWQELDRMLFCTKLPMCVIRYKKTFRIGKKDVKANLIQSLTLTLHQIKDITNKLKKYKR